MAAVVVTDSNNRVEDMETSPTITNIGAGQAGGVETVTFIQGAQSISRKVVNTAYRGTGVSFTAVDMTAGDDLVVLIKALLTDELDVNSLGFEARIGSSTTNYNAYIFVDDGTLPDRPVPPRSGWKLEAVDPSVTAWVDRQPASAPTVTAITDVQVACGLANGNAKSENIFLDSVDIGPGLFLVGGDSTDPDGVWVDFVDDDEGTLTAGRFGYVFTNASGIEIRGRIVRGRNASGTVTATVFTDTLQNLTWVTSRVAAGWNGLEDDLGNASTIITETSAAFAGAGRNNLKHYFDSESWVDGINEEIDIVDHSFATGDAVLYSDEGGTETIGLTDGTEYFINAVTADTMSFHTNRADAYAAANAVDLTASTAGNGENHSLRRQPDTRPDYDAVGTSGSAAYTGCSFVNFRIMTLTSAVTFTNCAFVSCYQMVLAGATLENCSVGRPLLSLGEAFLLVATAADLADIDGTLFNPDGLGHAIEVTTTTGSPTLTDVVFSDYGPAQQTFDTETDVTGGATDTIAITSHPYVDGDPVYYADDGGTETIGLTDDALYYVNSVDANTVSLHVTEQDATSDTNRVDLTASGGGNGETHSLYSANAAFHNSTGGTVTLNITGGNAPSVRNSGGSTTIVNISVAIEINGVTEGSRCAIIGDGGAEDGVILLEGYADSTGTVSGSFSGSTPQTVVVRARNGGIIAAALQDDNTVFTDYTNEAREDVGTDDVLYLPAVPATGDAFYLGGLAVFEKVTTLVTTAGATYVSLWEYWDGSVWSTLTVVDDTNNLQTTGTNDITFTAPTDWVTTSVDGNGPFYYIRLRVTTGGGTGPEGERVTLHDTVKYLPFSGTGTIQSGSGLTATAVWIEDPINP